MSHPRTALFGWFVALFCLSVPANAQPLGTFRWQLQPYCNIVTVNVAQQGGLYTLDGTDDRCGAEQAASAVGLAFLNPGGTVGFGLSIVLPGGTPVHVEATINLPSLNGTWRDSAGNSGAFIFTPAAGVGGAPRPVPAGGVAPASITSAEIAPNAVGSSQIAAGAVTTAHIAPNGVGTSQIAASAVGSAQIAPGAVGNSQIAAGAVGGSQIAPGAVGSTQIAASAITGVHVLNGSLTIADVADAPRAALAGGLQAISLTSTDAVVRTVAMTAPAAGKIIVNASGYFHFLDAAGLDGARCSITTGTAVEFSFLIIAGERSATAMNYLPFASTRGFAVTAGAVTINLVCNKFSGDVLVVDTSLTAIFIAGS